MYVIFSGQYIYKIKPLTLCSILCFTFMCLIKYMHIKQLLLEKIRTRTN